MLSQLYFWVGLGGTVFLGASLIGGGGGSHLDASGSHEATVSEGGDSHLEASVPGEVSTGFIPSNILSFRTAMFFCTFFGWSGFISLKLLGTPALGSLAIALPMGLICAFIGAKTIELLRRGEVSSSYYASDLVGKEADVTLPITNELPGRIRCYVKGSTVEYKAMALFPNEAFERLERVLIAEATAFFS
jgi:membrane protein implicated in regulation of membrane protease activity